MNIIMRAIKLNWLHGPICEMYSLHSRQKQWWTRFPALCHMVPPYLSSFDEHADWQMTLVKQGTTTWDNNCNNWQIWFFGTDTLFPLIISPPSDPLPCCLRLGLAFMLWKMHSHLKSLGFNLKNTDGNVRSSIIPDKFKYLRLLTLSLFHPLLHRRYDRVCFVFCPMLWTLLCSSYKQKDTLLTIYTL